MTSTKSLLLGTGKILYSFVPQYLNLNNLHIICSTDFRGVKSAHISKLSSNTLVALGRNNR